MMNVTMNGSMNESAELLYDMCNAPCLEDTCGHLNASFSCTQLEEFGCVCDGCCEISEELEDVTFWLGIWWGAFGVAGVLVALAHLCGVLEKVKPKQSTQEGIWIYIAISWVNVVDIPFDVSNIFYFGVKLNEWPIALAAAAVLLLSLRFDALYAVVHPRPSFWTLIGLYVPGFSLIVLKCLVKEEVARGADRVPATTAQEDPGLTPASNAAPQQIPISIVGENFPCSAAAATAAAPGGAPENERKSIIFDWVDQAHYLMNESLATIKEARSCEVQVARYIFFELLLLVLAWLLGPAAVLRAAIIESTTMLRKGRQGKRQRTTKPLLGQPPWVRASGRESRSSASRRWSGCATLARVPGGLY